MYVIHWVMDKSLPDVSQALFILATDVLSFVFVKVIPLDFLRIFSGDISGHHV